MKENVARVRNLLAIYETTLSGPGPGRRGHSQTDALRAATVLLHASLEDCLRSIAYWRWPQAGTEVIEKIPLVSVSPATKFNLGNLVAYRGQSVDDVIKASVDAYLDRSNYNNIPELVSFIASVGVEKAKVEAWFPVLEQMMSRRHQIVHRADRNEIGGRGNHSITSIGRRKVREWVDVTERFCDAILDEIAT